VCGGGGSKHLAFQLSYVADAEKCPSRDMGVREGLSEPNLVVLHAQKSNFSVRTC